MVFKSKRKSTLGLVHIGVGVLSQYISDAVNSCPGVAGLSSVYLGDDAPADPVDDVYEAESYPVKALNSENSDTAGYVPGIEIRLVGENSLQADIHVAVAFGININETAHELSYRVEDYIESYTGFKVDQINIYIDEVRHFYQDTITDKSYQDIDWDEYESLWDDSPSTVWINNVKDNYVVVDDWEEAPAESNTTEEAPAEADSIEEAPAEADTTEEAPAEADTTEEAPAESNTTEEEPAEADSIEEEPAEADTTEEEPAESDTIEEEPAESDTIEEEPAESDTIEEEPAEADTTEEEPAGSNPIEEMPEISDQYEEAQLPAPDDLMEEVFISEDSQDSLSKYQDPDDLDVYERLIRGKDFRLGLHRGY